jgi:N-acetylneuraminic acid mutarotase
LPDGLVLVGGGFTLAAAGGDTTATATCELYSPRTGSFSAAGSMSTARAFQTATLLPDGRVLIVGGEHVDGSGNSAVLASAELYEP